MTNLKWRDPHFIGRLPDGSEYRLTPARAMERACNEISRLQNALNDLLITSEHSVPTAGERDAAMQVLCSSMGCPVPGEVVTDIEVTDETGRSRTGSS